MLNVQLQVKSLKLGTENQKQIIGKLYGTIQTTPKPHKKVHLQNFERIRFLNIHSTAFERLAGKSNSQIYQVQFTIQKHYENL